MGGSSASLPLGMDALHAGPVSCALHMTRPIDLANMKNHPRTRVISKCSGA